MLKTLLVCQVPLYNYYFISHNKEIIILKIQSPAKAAMASIIMNLISLSNYFIPFQESPWNYLYNNIQIYIRFSPPIQPLQILHGRFDIPVSL